MNPIDRARKLIADSEARLVEAEKVFTRNRYAVCDLNSVRQMLARVRWWKAQPEGAVSLALGDLGENKFGPLIDRLCSLADAERKQQRRAA